jgi:hypothetical protein
MAKCNTISLSGDNPTTCVGDNPTIIYNYGSCTDKYDDGRVISSTGTVGIECKQHFLL